MRELTAHEADLARESARLEARSPKERLAYAVATWGERLLFTSSFGAGSAVLLHLWSEVAHGLPVVFIDTGFLFDETHAYKDRLVAELGLTVRTVTPETPRDAFLREHGDDVMRREPDFCCAANKVLPVQPLVDAADAWVSGLRRDQSDTRKDVPILLAPAEPGSPIKVHPLATMTASDVADYMQRHALPEHPLRARRYLSIGCAPCTAPVEEGAPERAGRWAFSAKTECGLHARPRR